MEEKITYEDALKELKNIQQLLEKNEIPIDQIADKIKRANELLLYCRTKLRSAEDEINKALEN
ncbi:exodeoxyribonuclease VII small subunit [Limibacter armeniacum]|uniref:exodeoxyribonuclease VII small subunit n=1 Tax=Limibacter armeniacum TaxID=466084 RepID=UPI002FE639F7